MKWNEHFFTCLKFLFAGTKIILLAFLFLSLLLCSFHLVVLGFPYFGQRTQSRVRSHKMVFQISCSVLTQLMNQCTAWLSKVVLVSFYLFRSVVPNKLQPQSVLGSSFCSASFLFFFFLILFIFWLCWVLVAARGLSLVAVSGGYSSLQCTAFSLRWLLLLWSMGSRQVDFSRCGAWAQ